MSTKIQARIPDDLAARLDAYVTRLQAQTPGAEVSRSTVTRAALEEFLSRKEPPVKHTNTRMQIFDFLK